MSQNQIDVVGNLEFVKIHQYANTVLSPDEVYQGELNIRMTEHYSILSYRNGLANVIRTVRYLETGEYSSDSDGDLHGKKQFSLG